MKNKFKTSKMFFILALLCFAIYFFASLPYGLENNTRAISGNWFTVDVSNSTLSPVDGVCYINTAEDLGKMLQLINSGSTYQGTNYNALNYVLTSNIDLNKDNQGHYWTPIKEFKGTFDGQGYTISNINVETNDGYCAMFGKMVCGIIKNLNLKNIILHKVGNNVSKYSFLAGFVGEATESSKIENCTLSGMTLATTIKVSGLSNVYFGGFVGRINNSTLSYCKVLSGTFSLVNTSANWIASGGIVGLAYSDSNNTEKNSTIEYCSSDANMKEIYNFTEVNCGGIIGKCQDNVNIIGCCNTGNISVGTYANGTENYSNIEKAHAGGIVGFSNATGEIKYCFNKGTITAYAKRFGLGSYFSVVTQGPPQSNNNTNQFNFTYEYAWQLAVGNQTQGHMMLICNPNINSDGCINYNGKNYAKFLGYNKYQSPYINEFGYKAYGGGIIGYVEGGNLVISECYNTGVIGNAGKSFIGIDCSVYMYEMTLYDKILLDSNPITYKTNCYAVHFEVFVNYYYLYDTRGAIVGCGNPKTVSKCYSSQNIEKHLEFNYITTDPGYTSDPNGNNYITYTRHNLKDRVENFDLSLQEQLKESATYKLVHDNNGKYHILLGKNGNDFYMNVWFGNNDKKYKVFTAQKLYGEHNSNINMLIANGKLDSNVWATDSNINDGLPYIKAMYWNNTTEITPSFSFNFEFDEGQGSATLTKLNVSGNLKTIEIPQIVVCNGKTYTVTTIGNNACKNIDSLEEIILPNTIKLIGEHAFNDCDKLQKINMPTHLTEIKKHAFDHCDLLNNIKLPKTLKIIGDNAFAACLSLTEITVPNSVTDIGRKAFGWCVKLQKLTIPFIGKKKDSIGELAIFGYLCADSNVENMEDLIKIEQKYYDGSVVKTKNVYVPTSLRQIIITDAIRIEKCAFHNCNMITNVQFPNTLTTIGDFAFEGSGLSGSLNLNNGGRIQLKTIGSYAFKGCTALTVGTIYDGVTSIGEGAFENCTSLEQISWPKRTTKIANNTFKGCNNLKKTVYWYNKNGVEWKDGLPDRVTSIGNYAFYNCYKFAVFGLSSIRTIGDNAFYNCFNTGSVYIINLENVKVIGNGAFAGCKYLNIAGLNKIEKIGDNAFKGCDNLSGVWDNKLHKNVLELSASLNELGSNSFQNCEKLMYIKFNGTYDEWKELNGTHKNGNAGDKANINDECTLRCKKSVNYYTEYKLKFSLSGYYWSSIGDVYIN